MGFAVTRSDKARPLDKSTLDLVHVVAESLLPSMRSKEALEEIVASAAQAEETAARKAKTQTCPACGNSLSPSAGNG